MKRDATMLRVWDLPTRVVHGALSPAASIDTARSRALGLAIALAAALLVRWIVGLGA